MVLVAQQDYLVNVAMEFRTGNSMREDGLYVVHINILRDNECLQHLPPLYCAGAVLRTPFDYQQMGR